ncbi:Putative U-box domain-containing protein 53 [Apostasia shenzhenica]|uniref:RING-type E3 ubiquitin transferase n=1 Tax=Apostasia shenzhenica TaxID=1088818 RepID=A0A2I0AYU7_9ASPA|nr:Putative U-box domain-containing protein 53 [Apostasia shenzhenica]
MEKEFVEEVPEPSAASLLSIAVAVNGSKSSKRAARWALDKFLPEGIVHFKLLYVRPKITVVPTPMGNYLPISKVRDDVATAYKKEIEWHTTSMLLTYRQMLTDRRVEAENVTIESDDVADALAREISKLRISKLVVGASSQNVFRNFKGHKLSSKIANCCPSFCTVYVVSKGKLASIRAATSQVDDLTNDEISTKNLPCTVLHSGSTSSSSCGTFKEGRSSLFIYEDTSSSSVSLSEQQFDSRIGSSSGSSLFMDQSLVMENAASVDQIDIDSELQKLRVELKHLQNMVEVVQNESIASSEVLSAHHIKEEAILKEIEGREEVIRKLTRLEIKRREAVEREAEYIMEYVEKEVQFGRDAEESAAQASCHKERFEKAFSCETEPYKTYTWEEIESATLCFSDSLKIGMGANGTVYKGRFHHTLAAVKVLHSNEAHGNKQFKQELDILGRIRHPHMLVLLGACLDRGCLVYEFMENGSLDDRLQCRDNSPPLPWFFRFRIAWEVASALAFLHSSNPDPIIHRDLKPANILLDCNFVSKIGDVGLSTLLSTVNFPVSSIYKDTAPVGTICYIDPEYQRTGRVSPKSDVYALGIVILQLLTGKLPMGLAYIVESAVEDDSLSDILDAKAGQWPDKETQELAQLGLHCAELRHKDRPDLEDQVLPVLERLRIMADEAKILVNHPSPTPPSHFICPILQEVMEDPCVASDGYTYDRKAIDTWLEVNETSPMTNLPLPNKNLIPSHSLRSAIMEWRSIAK